jgi:DNA polymerase-1
VDSPGRFLELLALMGDKSDNVPGAPGIGEKTAAKLLLEHGTLENLFNNLGKLKGKVQEVLTAHKENVLLAKQLCTICTDVPLDCIPTDLRVKKPDFTKIRPIFSRMNFSGLEKRVNSRVSKPESVQGNLFDMVLPEPSQPEKFFSNIDNTDHTYKTISNEEQLAALVNQILGLNEFCIDTETSSLNP